MTHKMFSLLRFTRQVRSIAVAMLLLGLALCGASNRLRADTGSCGSQTITLPFTDVMGSTFFCSIAEIYFQEITFGTTPTTYSPSANVTRDQMAAFLSRTLDTGLRRGSERAALDQFWTTTPHYDLGLGTTTLGGTLNLTRSDGLHVWVADTNGDNVYRVRASDGNLVDTWTGATDAYGVVCAMGRVFITGNTSPNGSLYMIDPSGPAGAVTTLTSMLGSLPLGIGFDGNKIWTANNNSLSTASPTAAWSPVTIIGPFGRLVGFAYDGSNMWVTDQGDNSIKKMDAFGSVLQTVALGAIPEHPAFDGKNIWVPTLANSVAVVRASTGEVLATLTGNGLSGPRTAAFDGERVLVTNFGINSVSLWKASDLTPLGNFSTGSGSDPWGACSDGQYFWVTLRGTGQLARF